MTSIIQKIDQLRHSIRWHLFITLSLIILICQLITVSWLWYESREQIDALVDLTLSQEITDAIVRQEEIEAIFALFLSTLIIMSVTLILAYKTIKKVTQPLELLEKNLSLRTAENLEPIDMKGNKLANMHEIVSITAALNNLFNRLNETIQQERLFTADVAHELRTPLAGIRLHLELLERDQHISCHELIDRIDRLVNTVEQLLTLARAGQNFIIGKEQDIDFRLDIMHEMIDELEDMLQLKQQTLTWYLNDEPLVFQGDKILICLLIRNLVENASRYSQTKRNIEICCHKYTQEQIIIEVKDQGVGLDETKITQLTQAFFRMDRRHKGIGLGLSIVHRIVNLHHGQLTLRNRDDGQQGTVVQCIFNPK